MNLLANFFFLLLVGIQCQGQLLTKARLSKTDRAAVILYSYQYTSKYDGYIVLDLFKSNRFEYSMTGTSKMKISEGVWKVEKGELILNSSIQSDKVPIQFEFDSEIDSVRWRNRTPLQVPRNLNGERLSDSRVFLNDSLTFCFPFFDTCIGNFPKQIQRIKADFGNGFTSEWAPLNKQHFKVLKVIAVTKVDFTTYISFRNKRYKISGKSITPLN